MRDSGIEMEDPRIKWVTMQVYKSLLADIDAALAGEEK